MFRTLTIIGLLFFSVGASAESVDIYAYAGGRWHQSGDRTLVITYFRQRYSERHRNNYNSKEPDDVVGLLLINQSDITKFVQVYCFDDNEHLMLGRKAFRFSLNLKPRETRQLFAQNDIIREFDSVMCFFEGDADQLRGNLMIRRMNGSPPTSPPPPAARPNIDDLRAPPEPVFEWSPGTYNRREEKE